MNLELSLVNILILFGAVQGITFMVILFANKRHPGAAYLGLAVLALVYNGLETFNWSSNLEDYVSFFDYFPFVLIFLVGPSFYLYQYSLLRPDRAASPQKILLSYSPFIFQFSYLLICWIAYHLTKSPSLFYRLDKDLGAVKIPVVVFTAVEKEMKIYLETEWQELSLEVGLSGEVRFDESSFLLEYSEITSLL